MVGIDSRTLYYLEEVLHLFLLPLPRTVLVPFYSRIRFNEPSHNLIIH